VTARLFAGTHTILYVDVRLTIVVPRSCRSILLAVYDQTDELAIADNRPTLEAQLSVLCC